MLIGAHVSPAGGPANAVARGVERGCDAIQIFNQNPRAWKPTVYSDEQVADVPRGDGDEPRRRAAHPRRLPAQLPPPPTRRCAPRRARRSSPRCGPATRSAPHAVVLHPGSALAGKVAPAIKRAGKLIAQALSRERALRAAPREHRRHRRDARALLPGARGALRRRRARRKRLGLCLDSCHLFASGYDIRTEEGLAAALDECDAAVGRKAIGSLHLNDSQTPLGSNRDRHADIGEGELGRRGCAVFLSEPRFDGLPCVLETPGPTTTVRRASRSRSRGAPRGQGTKRRR